MSRFIEDHYTEDEDALWDPQIGAFVPRPSVLWAVLFGTIAGLLIGFVLGVILL